MNDDRTSVKILVMMMFEKQFKSVEKMIALNPYIPSCMQTREFYERLQLTLDIRKRLIGLKWGKFFDSCYKKMLSSHKTYLTFIMFACLTEHQCQIHIFKTFISVCALVKLLSEEILQKTDVNFCDLNPDIIRVFYHYQLKKTFVKEGGLQHFLTFINYNKYVTWALTKKYGSIDAPSTIEKELDEKLMKEMRDPVIEIEINPDEAMNNAESNIMADAVLNITLFTLPPLPNYADLIMRLVAFRKKDALRKEENKRKTEAVQKFEALNVTPHESPDSIPISSKNYDMKYQVNPNKNEDIIQAVINQYSISNENYDMKYQENTEKYEKIIQAIIRHNHSKYTGNVNAKGRIQEEADRVLMHLKETIGSLIEILSEYDKELKF